jgi:FMN phosphatase YigB (HAD superfamily)
MRSIFCFAELGFRKNQAGFWQAVQSTLGGPLARVAMVCDNLEHDVHAPRSFGVQAVWFNEGGRLQRRCDRSGGDFHRIGGTPGFDGCDDAALHHGCPILEPYVCRLFLV